MGIARLPAAVANAAVKGQYRVANGIREAACGLATKQLTSSVQMTKWILIAAGGALGSVLRYAVQGWAQRAATDEFPVGTLTVNIIGCVLIGFLSAVFTGPVLIREEYRLGLIVGMLGGFTTFSAFGWETFSLAQDREFAFAALNVLLSCGLGLVAVWIGYRAAEYWYGVS
jgi:fluoride exporter